MNIAVITGASSGMGREFVKQIDSFGLDEIWGIALDEAGLDSLEKEVKTKLKKFALDLTDAKSFDILVEALSNGQPNVVWLANCSGFCKFGDYATIPLKISVNMIELNDIALVKMTELFLPYMKENAKIIQIASMAGLQSTPYMNVYGASKAFVLSYSRGLSAELKPRKISCTCMCPLWTNTNFLKEAQKTSDSQVGHISSGYDAAKVVARGINDAKLGKVVSFYGAKSKLQVLAVKLLPHSLVMKLWLSQQKKSGNSKIK